MTCESYIKKNTEAKRISGCLTTLLSVLFIALSFYFTNCFDFSYFLLWEIDKNLIYKGKKSSKLKRSSFYFFRNMKK